MDRNLYFDAHFHLFGDTAFGNALAKNIGEQASREYFMNKYHINGNMIGGIVMGNGLLEKQGIGLPDRFFYCVGLDQSAYFPLKDETYTQLEQHLKNEKCVGIKLYPGYIPLYPNDKQYYKAFELLLKYHKVLAVHTGMLAGLKGKLKYTKPIYLDDIAVDFPDLKIVMCHFGNPFLEEAAAVMEHNDNVYADLSGLIEGQFKADNFIENETDYMYLLKAWINYVGDHKRFMFGTDWPAVNCDEYSKFISQLFDSEYTEDILINNAIDIYGVRERL